MKSPSLLHSLDILKFLSTLDALTAVSPTKMTAPEPDGFWLSSRQDSRPIPEAYGGVRAGIRPGFNPVYLGKLAFNPVPVVAEFIQQSGGHSAKTMRAHFILFKIHAACGPAESGFSKGNVLEW